MAAIARVSRVFSASTGTHAALAMRAVSNSATSHAPIAACGVHASSACAGVHMSGSVATGRVPTPTPSTTRAFHTSRAAASAKNPGPVEQKFRKEFGNYKSSGDIDASMVAPTPAGKKAYSVKVQRLAAELTNLTLLETVELNDLLKQALGLSATDLLFSGFGAPGGAAPAAAPAPAAAAPAPAAAPKEEKTHFDIKLKKFDAKDKIKVIKEVRGVTNLGLKEAKELVESAPCTILTKVKKEDAAKIIETLKTATGAELELV